MSDHEHFERPTDSRISRQAKHEISLSSAQQSDIIDNLTATIDELRIFATPMTTARALGNVALDLGSDSRLPSSYSNLSLMQSRFEDGTYKTKLTLPGKTLQLYGSNDSHTGLWRVTSGDRELAAYEHTDLVAHLDSILPPRTMSTLADAAHITDGEITDELWRSLSPLSTNWFDSRQYIASDYAFSVASDPRAEDYYNEVGAMLGYVDGQSADDGRFKRYTSRIGTERPIDLSWSNHPSADKPATVNQEFYFEVKYPEKIGETRTTLAHLALQSTVISSSRLDDLGRSTVLHLDDPTSVYYRTSALVRSAHLDKDNVN
ncbi:MAG: hypothetical protein ABWX90_01660 [Candidatus Saccharimonadales bacterium]